MRRTYIFVVSIVDQLHEQQDVDEKLALRVLHDFSRAKGSAVELLISVLSILQRGSLAWEGQSVVEVWDVVLHDEHSVAQLEELAQFFELFG